MTHSADLNLTWARLIVEELHRLGVQHICLAPGSRSTPLTLAAADHPSLQRHTHFDERGLAFMALGLAKSTDSPVAIITTSGTAVANLYPALVEAAQTNVPLIVLSGDRPPELIDCGANQAIVQPAIFADYAKRLDLPAADLNIQPQALLAQLDHAMADLQHPLHINCMFREPLYPDGSRTDFSHYLAPIKSWRQETTPWLSLPAMQQQALPTTVEIEQLAQGKGVIVAATIGPEQQPEQILALAKRLGWPILADAQSQLRQHPDAINHIDQLFHHDDAKLLLQQADTLLWFGGRLLSKRLINFIDNHQWQALWHCLPVRRNLDPSHLRKSSFVGSINSFCQLPWPTSTQANWAKPLARFNQQLEQQFAEHEYGKLTELSAIRSLSALANANNNLFIGNSLPIRLFDMLAKPQAQPAAVFTNRGASGIDGLFATCCGVARGNGKATLMAIGDISALHDLNSLALARQTQQPIVIMALNNDGGSIFNMLPVPNEQLRENYYRLGHGLNFKHIAAQFELEYKQPTTLTELQTQMAQALSRNGTTLVEVVVPAGESADLIVATAKQIRG
ncbi:2-succinyl-5-enolpyruvyl-6-hydroxy-3-cyclohexene-1-carboxylic-acid synthase [Ferrimonas lipolytica]|uniref:2-succinyl-5-enolpyruvyl-6-hydroxy-3-cyclohexene-1-carboxylate synthase n=1 Tax=Ferrimonas lipolytica TaxID=2724191 RepID=A0A6H1UK48_9GAMM|nr:2-succinyl-5-enolpyruvyl-6-hydroxy-3-cyclohexene-1-carboxylic-acid synthase [Ferrimonas lipolytica]QIZ78182.1 2-succinyl-5-enolpyruvyl-6-hydroxy-3-cyclohexene-1-carboxylic-acid synthase [Ferrimonas lipolytica]